MTAISSPSPSGRGRRRCRGRLTAGRPVLVQAAPARPDPGPSWPDPVAAVVDPWGRRGPRRRRLTSGGGAAGLLRLLCCGGAWGTGAVGVPAAPRRRGRRWPAWSGRLRRGGAGRRRLGGPRTIPKGHFIWDQMYYIPRKGGSDFRHLTSYEGLAWDKLLWCLPKLHESSFKTKPFRTNLGCFAL